MIDDKEAVCGLVRGDRRAHTHTHTREEEEGTRRRRRRRMDGWMIEDSQAESKIKEVCTVETSLKTELDVLWSFNAGSDIQGSHISSIQVSREERTRAPRCRPERVIHGCVAATAAGGKVSSSPPSKRPCGSHRQYGQWAPNAGPASTGSSRRDGQRSAGTKSEATFSRVFRVWRCAVIGCFAVVLGRLAAGGKAS